MDRYSKHISIGKLHSRVIVEDINYLCSLEGYVEKCKISKKGFAYVTMGTQQQAKAVYNAYSGRELDGYPLTIRFIGFKNKQM